MATYRIGIGSFSLAESGGVGIGTDTAGLGNLRVEGTTKTTDLDVLGVSTFTRYAGFAEKNISIGNTTTITGEHSTIGDIVVGLNSTFTVSSGATITLGTVESVSIGTHFSPPTGDINDRPEDPVEGTVRFNEDLNTLEFYNGVDWRQFVIYGAGLGDRAIIGNGAADENQILTLNISSKGNTEDFGTSVSEAYIRGYGSSTSRAILNGGYGVDNAINTIEYVTIATSGKGVDFGDTSAAHFRNCTASSSSTRNLMFGGGHPSYYNTIEYVEIAQKSNGIDFGNLTQTGASRGSFSSPTRGFVSGGFPSYQKNYDMVTIASTGNAVDFGDMTANWFARGGAANNTRGIFAGGYSPNITAGGIIEFITMASGGNFQYFGDLTLARNYPGTTSSHTRAIFAAGYSSLGANSNVIDYVNIASSGNAMDFGDTNRVTTRYSATSNCHGGLGGF